MDTKPSEAAQQKRTEEAIADNEVPYVALQVIECEMGTRSRV